MKHSCIKQTDWSIYGTHLRMCMFKQVNYDTNECYIHSV